MEAYGEIPRNPLERFHAEITFPPDIGDISVLLQGVVRELRPGELRAMKKIGNAGRLEVFAEGSEPGVYLTGPNTPITNAVAFLLQQYGAGVRRASSEQVHNLGMSLGGPTPELWNGESPVPEDAGTESVNPETP